MKAFSGLHFLGFFFIYIYKSVRMTRDEDVNPGLFYSAKSKIRIMMEGIIGTQLVRCIGNEVRETEMKEGKWKQEQRDAEVKSGRQKNVAKKDKKFGGVREEDAEGATKDWL